MKITLITLLFIVALLLSSCGAFSYESRSVEASNGLVPASSSNLMGGSLMGATAGVQSVADERASKAKSFWGN